MKTAYHSLSASLLRLLKSLREGVDAFQGSIGQQVYEGAMTEAWNKYAQELLLVFAQQPTEVRVIRGLLSKLEAYQLPEQLQEVMAALPAVKVTFVVNGNEYRLLEIESLLEWAKHHGLYEKGDRK